MIRFKLTTDEKNALCQLLIEKGYADENESFKNLYVGVRKNCIGDREICVSYRGHKWGFSYVCTVLNPICKILKAHKAEFESIEQPMTSHYICTVSKNKNWFE